MSFLIKEYPGSGDQSHATDLLNSVESLLLLEDEVERATQSRDVVSKALEMDVETTLLELQIKVSTLNEKVTLLKTKLKNREEENKMWMKPTKV